MSPAVSKYIPIHITIKPKTHLWVKWRCTYSTGRHPGPNMRLEPLYRGGVSVANGSKWILWSPPQMRSMRNNTYHSFFVYTETNRGLQTVSRQYHSTHIFQSSRAQSRAVPVSAIFGSNCNLKTSQLHGCGRVKV